MDFIGILLKNTEGCVLEIIQQSQRSHVICITTIVVIENENCKTSI